jgi:hypothetical protein
MLVSSETKKVAMAVMLSTWYARDIRGSLMVFMNFP